MGESNQKQMRRLAAERVILAVGSGMAVQEAVKEAGLTMGGLGLALRDNPDLRERMKRAHPAPTDHKALTHRYIALLSAGATREGAARVLGHDLAAMAAMVEKAGMVGAERAAIKVAVMLHGHDPEEEGAMDADAALVLLLSVIPLYCAAQSPASSSDPGAATKAWPPLADVLATAGVDRDDFNTAKALQPGFWATALEAREKAKGEWVAEMREMMSARSMGGLNHLVGARTAMRRRVRKEAVPLLVDGKVVVHQKEHTVEEQMAVAPSLEAIKYFHLLNREGGLDPQSQGLDGLAVPVSEEDARRRLAEGAGADEFMRHALSWGKEEGDHPA